MNFIKFLRKSLASVTMTALVAGFVSFPTAQARLDFTDVNEIPSWGTEAIQELVNQGVLKGNDDGSFTPNRPLNRAEVSKIVIGATKTTVDTRRGPHFPDVAPGSWYYDSVETMYNKGWINGYPDGTFRPEANINRAEIAKMLVNAFELESVSPATPSFTDVSKSDWYYSAIETAVANRIMRGYGDGTFGPDVVVTRVETAVMSYNSQLVTQVSDTPADGTLEVKLAATTPRGTNVPFNATSVPYVTFEFTASDDNDVSISAINLKRLGLGDNDDFKDLWIEIDGYKVGSSKSVSNDDLAALRFSTPLLVSAGQTLTVDVVASSKATATDVGHINRFAVVSSSDIVSTASSVVGDFPIEGKEMQIANYQVTTLEFTEKSATSVSTVEVGETFTEIGSFSLQNKSTNSKNVELRGITFRNTAPGDINRVLDNLALYSSGDQVSSRTIVDGDYVTFQLDNGITGGMILKDGNTKAFSIKADIVGAENSDAIQFKIQNHEDIVAVEIGTGFGVNTLASTSNNTAVSTSTGYVALAACAATAQAEGGCATLGYYSVDSGDLNIVRDPSAPVNQDYAPGASNVEFLRFRVSVEQPIRVEGLKIVVAAISGVDNDTLTNDNTAKNAANTDSMTEFNSVYSDFKLYVNERYVASTNTLDGTATNVADDALGKKLNFDSTFDLTGTSTVRLVGSIDNEAQTNGSVKFSVIHSDFANPEYISSQDQVAAAKRTGTVTGNVVKTVQSALTITRADGFGSNAGKLVAGTNPNSASGTKFLSFILDNNNSGDVLINSVKVTGTGTGEGKNGGTGSAAYDKYDASLYVGGVQKGSARSLNKASGIVEFTSLQVTIPDGEQREFQLAVNLQDSLGTSTSLGTVASTASGTITLAANLTKALAVGDVVRFTTPAGAVSTATVTTAGATTQKVITASAHTATAQKSTYTLTGTPTQGTATAYTATVGGTAFSFTGDTTATLTELATGLATAIAANAAYGATSALGVITVTAATAGTPFVIANTAAANGVTITAATTTATLAGATAALKNTVKFNVTSVTAENKSNGKTVAVTPTTLAGAEFELISSGTLTISASSANPSAAILLGGQKGAEVLRLDARAADDSINITDLYFENDTNGTLGTPTATEQTEANRFRYHLYSSTGELLNTTSNVSGFIHFDLGTPVTVPKGKTISLSVKVDTSSISQSTQTGKRLNIALSSASATKKYGIEAKTAATGSEITTPTVAGGWGTGASRANFVAYKSRMTIAHAATQVGSYPANSGLTPYYKFTVSADAAGPVELNKLTLNFALKGVVHGTTVGTATAFASDNSEFDIRRVNTDGSIDTTTTVATVAQTKVTDGIAGKIVATFAAGQGKISAGTSQTYAFRIAGLVESTTKASDAINGIEVTYGEDASYAVPAAQASVTSTNIVWSDESGSNHSATTADWFNGYLVRPPQSKSFTK